jgi:predicted RNase H-like HicB family nuclease
MKTYDFKVILEPDEDFDGNPLGWHVYCPALKKLGGSTWGETREEALKNIGEVVHMTVQEFMEEGKPLPEGPRAGLRLRRSLKSSPTSQSRFRDHGYRLPWSAVAHRSGA